MSDIGAMCRDLSLAVRQLETDLVACRFALRSILDATGNPAVIHIAEAALRAPDAPVTPPEPEPAPSPTPDPQNAATGQPGATKRGCDSCRHPKSGPVALCWACVIAEDGPTNWEAP